LGKGFKSGEAAGEAGGAIGGRRRETVGGSAGESDDGVGAIFGGKRRNGATGVRDGRTIRAVSRWPPFEGDGDWSGRGGSAIRTVSFFGSAMSGHLAASKVAQLSVRCHLLTSANRKFSGRVATAVTPADRNRGCR
jgi:hypothetical protein